MVKRSYIKEKDLTSGVDFKKSKAIGGEFGTSKARLSNLGNDIINKFVEDNSRKETFIKQREEEIDKYRKSKPEPYINPWKYANHTIGEFSTPQADQVHSFKQEKKKKFLIQQPFYRPSDYGKY